MLRKAVFYLWICAGTLAFSSAARADEAPAEDPQKKPDAGLSQPAAPIIPLPYTPATPQIPKLEKSKTQTPEKAKPQSEDEQTVELKESVTPAAKESLPLPVPLPLPQSPLEKLITSDETLQATKIKDANPAKTLTQFGYNYFKNVLATPQTDIPVSADYLTGPGDTLILNLWGSVEGVYELTVTRSGEVLLPRVGPVKVVGMPFGKLSELFRLRLTKEFRDFNLSVNMGKLHAIKVYVVGEVNAPGDYSVSSLSSLLNALSAAGGPTKNGSLRGIVVRHPGKAEETVDLYGFFTRGDKSRDIRLTAGDTIFVPVVGRVAAIAGDVKRPAIYELKEEKTLQDLLALAEGCTAMGYLQQVQISRVVPNEKKKVIDLNLDDASSGKTFQQSAAAVSIQDLDIVRIHSINSLLRDHFRLKGHVDRPGFYALKPGLRLSSVLTVEHFLPEYYPGFVEITRLSPPELQPQKIVVDLEAVWRHDPLSDLEIKEFDVIRVFSRLELEREPKVKVSGEVQHPGEYRLFKQMTLRDLLIQAGYPSPSAYLAGAEISRLRKNRDKVTSFAINVNLTDALTGDPGANIELQPFDELVVRKIPNWAAEKERYVTLSGEFRFPGSYPIYKGERLSSVIERAGGFSDLAYLPGAKLTRESLRELQQKRMDEALSKAEQVVTKKQSDLVSIAASKEEADSAKMALDGLQRNLELLKNKRAEGRLLIDIGSLQKLKNSHADLELKGGDTLFVPSDPNAVNVLGEVYNPASIAYEPQHDLGYYLNLVGGPSDDADEGQMYIVKMDGTVFSKQQSSMFFNKFSSRRVDSGDTIIVPQRYDKTAWMREIKDVATILGQVALTAGVLVAAGL